MNKDFIPYTLALALKKLGFNERCLAYYTFIKKDDIDWFTIPEQGFEKGKQLFGANKDYNTKFYAKEGTISAPTFSQAFRFFREKYKLLGCIEPANGYEDKCLFAFYICTDEQNIVDDTHSYSKDGSLHFNTYEEAELACLIKLIEIANHG
jgi:hypothetical protein